MSINIGGYNFEGPYSSPAFLKNQSGVYAILCSSTQNNWKVVDIGESEDVRTRVENHDRAGCWKRNCPSGPSYAAYYCDERTRMRVEQELRAKYNPPCGDR